MIKIECRNEPYIEFGHGDICISGGSDWCGEDEGCILFTEQEPQELGSKSSRAGAMFCPDDELNMRFTFKNTKSIDVLIEQLEITKKDMAKRGLK